MRPCKQQRGSTLLVALIMLVLLTLIAVSAMNSTTSSIQVVGNAQFREEAVDIGQRAIEGVISSNFTILPTSATVTTDINKDGVADYTATIPAPSCTGSVPIKNADLNMNDANDVPCFSGSTAANTGIMYVAGAPTVSGTSWCLRQQWDVEATVSGNTASSGAQADIHQGVGMRVPAGTACP